MLAAPYQKPSYPRPELPEQEVAPLPEAYAWAVVEHPLYEPFASPWAELKDQPPLAIAFGAYGYCVVCGCPLKDFATHEWYNAEVALCKSCGKLPLWRIASTGGLRFTSAEFYAEDLDIPLPPPNREARTPSERDAVRYYPGKSLLRAWKKNLDERRAQEAGFIKHKLAQGRTPEDLATRRATNARLFEEEEKSLREFAHGPLPKRGRRVSRSAMKSYIQPLPRMPRPELSPRERYVQENERLWHELTAYDTAWHNLPPVPTHHCYFCGHPFKPHLGGTFEDNDFYGVCTSCALKPLYTVAAYNTSGFAWQQKTTLMAIPQAKALRELCKLPPEEQDHLLLPHLSALTLPQAEEVIALYKPIMACKDHIFLFGPLEQKDNASFL